MTDIQRTINKLYAIQDVCDEIERIKKRYMDYDNETDTWIPPVLNESDDMSEYNYNRFILLNDIITDLYIKAGIKPNKTK